MKNNTKIIAIILIGTIMLYFSKNIYNDHVLNKSIAACVIAHKHKVKNMTREEAEKYCKQEINKNIKK